MAISLGFALLSLALAARSFVSDKIPPLRMSAGAAGTRRHAVAEMIASHAAQDGLSIALAVNAGSEDSLKQLKARQIDVAIVSNGVVIPEDDQLAVLAVTQLEALHLLVRSEIASGQNVLDVLRGKRVNFGDPGSTEPLLAREILNFARLEVSTANTVGDFHATEFGKRALIDKCQAIQSANDTEKVRLIAELPDALILLDAPPSAVASQLIEAADYQIAPLPATQAFLLDNLQDTSNSITTLQREFLEPTTIPKHCYFGRRALPQADCETVGVRLLLVAHRDVSPVALKALMATLFESELAHRLAPRSPREIANPYAIHEAAIAYLDRDKPVAVDKALEWLSNGLSVFGAFGAGALSLYGLLRTRATRQPSDYYESIRKVELLTRTLDREVPEGLTSQELLEDLDQRLVHLRQDLIEDICEGRIQGEQLVSNILALLNDVRSGLQARQLELGRPRPSAILSAGMPPTKQPIIAMPTAESPRSAA